jgi:hypothetical protein
MANEITNPFGGAVKPLDTKAMAARAKESANEAPQRGGESEFLNFSGKKGVYSDFQDGKTVTPDEPFLLNVASFMDGWIAWKGGKPVAKLWYNIFTEQRIPEPDHDLHGPYNTAKGEGWQSQRGWQAKSLDNDRQIEFSNSSVSGKAEMGDMLKEVSRRMASGEPCWPVFVHDLEQFEAQGFKNYKPIFAVIGWLDDAALPELSGDGGYDLDELFADSVKRTGSAAVTGAPEADEPSESENPGDGLDDDDTEDAEVVPDKPEPRRRRTSEATVPTAKAEAAATTSRRRRAT